MNYAVIKTGGKQHLIKEDETFKVEKLPGEAGEKFEFDQVLMKFDDSASKMEVGKPFIKDAKIQSEIVEQGRSRKVRVVKYKAKTRYKKVQGHRQAYSKVKVGKI